MKLILFLLFTAAATVAFLLGCRSLDQLRRMDSPSDTKANDPFWTPIAKLFSTGNRSQSFRLVQRRTIWWFCAAALMLLAARTLL